MYLYKSCFDIIYTVVNNSCEDTSDSGYVPYDSQVYYGSRRGLLEVYEGWTDAASAGHLEEVY